MTNKEFDFDDPAAFMNEADGFIKNMRTEQRALAAGVTGVDAAQPLSVTRTPTAGLEEEVAALKSEVAALRTRKSRRANAGSSAKQGGEQQQKAPKDTRVCWKHLKFGKSAWTCTALDTCVFADLVNKD